MKIIRFFCFVFIVSCLFSMDIYCQETEQLTKNSMGSQQTSISKSGNFIIYASGKDYTAGGEGSGIWKMNLDGSNQTEILESDGFHNYNHPSLSPDDSMVVFSKDKVGGGGGIWILYLNNLTEYRITFGTEYEIGTRWSSNGSDIYFFGGPYGGNYNIKKIYLNNLTIESVLESENIDVYFDVSPYGDKIVFNRVIDNSNFNIFVMNSDGSNLTQITNNYYKDYRPSWGSDNKIYFSSNRNGTGFDLWSMDIDGYNQERLSSFEGNEFWPERIENGIFFYWDRKLDNSGDIWFMHINDSSPPPTPTASSLVMTTPEWRNVASVAALNNTIFVVEENVTERIMGWVDRNEPDYMFTLGFDAGMNNSYEIGYDDVPGLFYPGVDGCVLAETMEEAVLGSQIAALLGVPLVFEQGGCIDVIDVRGMTEEGIMEMYADELADSGANMNYLVVGNKESETFPLSARLAKKKLGFVVPVSVSGMNYEMNPPYPEQNIDNGVLDVIDSMKEASDLLGERKLFAESREHLIWDPLYIALIGGINDVPTIIMFDPGIELFKNNDGNYLLSDVFYSDLNKDGFFDASVGRFNGDVETVSFQIENIKDISGNGLVIGQYRYPKYIAKDYMGGGMFQAYAADMQLSQAGIGTGRLVEKRMESLTPDIDWTNLVGFIFDIGELMGSQSMGILGMVYAMIGLRGTVISAAFEFDWEEWYTHASRWDFIKLEHLPVFDGSLDLDNVGFLGYFGIGDENWKIPPEDRDEIELITNPYGRAEDFTELDYGGFLYDDHDMSAYSNMVSDTIGGGGTTFSSTGLIHDPFSQKTSYYVIGWMATGIPLGEAWRMEANMLNSNPWVFVTNLNPMVGNRIDLYLKERFERTIYGDPETFIEGPIPVSIFGQEFHIKPHNSFLAEAGIESEYQIDRRMLIVRNSESEMLDVGAPIIPLFVREIILPEGSEVINVSFSGLYRTYRRLVPITIPADEHYDEVEEREDYDDYSYKVNTLLDGRVLVRVFVPAVHYERWARVLQSGTVKVEYETPVELTMETHDIGLGETENIQATIFNEGETHVSGNLLVWVDNQSYSETVEVGPHGTGTFNFSFTPEEGGEYTVKAVLDSDNPVGPRYSSFSVRKKCWCPWRWCWRGEFRNVFIPRLLGILSRTA